MRLTQDDEMVHALAPDRSDKPFGKAILPRLCLAVAWAAWTIKSTLNRNDEGPGLFPGFLSFAEVTVDNVSVALCL